jgi:UDP-GlcNAc:undecaprenyl-phosphate/decaprenyl-phosphate GlcNAc-1-phosphate transferase
MLFYLTTFIAALGLSALLTYWVRNTAVAHGLKATPVYGRHTHTKPLPRLGGIAICLTFLLGALLYVPISRFFHASFAARSYFGILIPVFMIFLMGAYDDLKPLKPRSKIAVQAFAAVFLYFGGFGIAYVGSIFGGHIAARLVDLALTVVWVLLITNAFNLIDGLDGLAAGSAAISAVALLAVAIVGHNDLVTYLVIVLLGAILGFLPFNFHPASIFMGDSGSLFIGFLLSALAMAGPHTIPTLGEVAIPLLAFGLPILDVSLAVFRRILRRAPVFRGDTDHIHHKLLKRGLSHRATVVVLYFVTAAFVASSLILLADGLLLLPVLFIVGIGVCLGVQQLHYVEFLEFLRPVARRREIVTDQGSVRKAAEALNPCQDFRTICQALQENLQPIGLDAIRINNLGKDGFPMALLHSLRYDAEGKWFFEWSERKSDDAVWEYNFELNTNSKPTLGYASLFSDAPPEDVRLTSDLLAEEFKNSLSEAVRRATTRMTNLYQSEQNAELNLVRAACRAAD